ncbi:hypothetical protein BAY59_15815 [Prauserella coralliicola]|nr:hypothetical protein BAY59_15815 [Prauserella coralliicola]
MGSTTTDTTESETIMNERGTTTRSARAAIAAASATLFACLLAAQSGLLALTPVLASVAAEFDVSPATAGQLRAVSGLAAVVAAAGLVVAARHRDLRRLLTTGLSAITVGAVASAGAPSFWVLAGAQAVLGGGIALALAAGLAAAASWVPPERRATALSWALVGQPSAWIVGMPVVGALGTHSWRLVWALPFAASVVALVAVALRRRSAPEPGHLSARTLLRRPGTARWAVGEFLAYAGWAGVLVYSGSLLTEAHGASVSAAGTALGIGAVGFVLGIFTGRRWVTGSARRLLLVTGPVLAVATLLLGAFRPSFLFSVGLFALIAFFAGARMIAGSALGLDLDGVGPLQAMSLRAAAMQSGYLGGSVLGGIGLSVAGWPGLGAVLATSLLLTVPAAVVTFPAARGRCAPAFAEGSAR